MLNDTSRCSIQFKNRTHATELRDATRGRLAAFSRNFFLKTQSMDS